MSEPGAGKRNVRKDWSVGLPEWASSPLRQCLERLDDEYRFLHFSMRGLGQLTALPKLIEAMGAVESHLEREKNKDPSTAKLAAARRDAAWVEREIKNGYPLLHSHSLVALWSTLEVCAEDLAVCWLANRPDAWDAPQVKKLKISVGEYESLALAERPRFVVAELSRSLSVNFKTGVGRLEPLLEVFGLAPSVGSTLRRAIHELSQVRHVVVHAGGRADQKLLSECPWLPWKPGSLISVDHRLYGWYFRATYRYAERIYNQVHLAFGRRGCKCAGMDDVSPRPDAPLTAIAG